MQGMWVSEGNASPPGAFLESQTLRCLHKNSCLETPDFCSKREPWMIRYPRFWKLLLWHCAPFGVMRCYWEFRSLSSPIFIGCAANSILTDVLKAAGSRSWTARSLQPKVFFGIWAQWFHQDVEQKSKTAVEFQHVKTSALQIQKGICGDRGKPVQLLCVPVQNYRITAAPLCNLKPPYRMPTELQPFTSLQALQWDHVHGLSQPSFCSVWIAINIPGQVQ